MKLSLMISRIHSIEVKIVDMASKFFGNIEDWSFFFFSLLIRLIWFCDTAKLSNSALSNFKNRAHFPVIQTFQNQENLHRHQPWLGLGSY